MAAKREPRCIWPAWTIIRSSTWKSPKPIAQNMGYQEVHGWTTPASSREMTGVESQDTFNNVDGSLRVASVRDRRSPSASADYGNADLVRKKMGLHLETCQAGDHQTCSFVWERQQLGPFSHSNTHLEQMMKELIDEANNGTWSPNLQI